MDKSYGDVAKNCLISTACYVFTLALSAHQFWINSKGARSSSTAPPSPSNNYRSFQNETWLPCLISPTFQAVGDIGLPKKKPCFDLFCHISLTHHFQIKEKVSIFGRLFLYLLFKTNFSCHFFIRNCSPELLMSFKNLKMWFMLYSP